MLPLGEDAINAALLRRCLGDFASLPTPSLHLARLGQCLSATTTSMVLSAEYRWEDEEVPDGTHPETGEVFSDGCGYCSYKLLEVLYESLEQQQQRERGESHEGSHRSDFNSLLEQPSGSLPYSAFQVRLGGKKGVFSLRMGIEGRQIFHRRSMNKFETDVTTARLEPTTRGRRLNLSA